MNSSTAYRLLRFLEHSAGQSIGIREILRAVDRELPSRKRTKGTKKRGQGMHPRFEDDPHVLLSELELLGFVTMEKDRVRPADPFERPARVSFSPTGMCFAVVRGASSAVRDVFIQPDAVHGALPGDEVTVRLTGRRRDRFEGAVVEVGRRARTLFRMSLLAGKGRTGIPGTLLDLPGKVSAVIPTDRIPSDTAERLKPDTVVVVKLPGRRVRFLGAVFLEAQFVRFEDDTDMDVDFARVLMKYGLNPVYPEMSLPDASDDPEYAASSPAASAKGVDPERTDLTLLPTVTIDGPYAKDFDDAVSLTPIGRGRADLYVHIADVSHYVKRGTPLDDEALERATSVYLSQRVVPMLPPVLSENLCSLVADRKRYAFTAQMTVSLKTGEILNTRFYKSVIRVDKRLTYEDAEHEIDRPKPSGKIPVDLHAMWDLARRQKEHRLKQGRVDITIPEPDFILDKDGIRDIEFRDRFKSSMLIEEFMLSANQATAEFLRKRNVPVLYRVHEPMDDTKREVLNAFFGIYNIPFEMKDTLHKSIMGALAAVKKHGTPRVERIFNMVLLRSFMQANYRGEPSGHWGLGFRDYCHFTSPIRRYPDLVVHRALEAALKRKKPPYSQGEITELGFQTSERERRAMEADRDMTRLRLARYIQKKGRTHFEGFITGFRPDRVFVELVDVPAEGVVERHHLTNDHELVRPDEFSVFVKKLGRPAFLGEQWDLELERVDFEEIRLYFRPVFPPGKSKSPFVRPGR